MSSIARKLRREGKTVGFVPTMGALHGGHISLIREARQRSDIVIVSIFVNPTQFNDKRDLEKYPRDLTADAALLAQHDVDYVFAPGSGEIYGPGFSTYVTVEGLSDTLEGSYRPGHFRGVTTVVAILFIAIRPDFAYFGQKDAQQVAVLSRMTRDLGFETEIVELPTVREESGLAMSSRNELLSQEDREKAAAIFQALRNAKIEFKKGERNGSNLAEMVRNEIAAVPGAEIDYVTVVEKQTFQPIEKVDDKEAMILAAVRIGGVRLIDNILLNRKQ